MPQDLHAIAEGDTPHGMPELTKSPDRVEDRSSAMDAGDEERMVDSLSRQSKRQQLSDQPKRDELHPYTQTLSISDVDSCVTLEEQAFPPNERASREKFQYRLQTCGELSLGIFTSHSNDDISTSSTSAPVYSGAPRRKAVLLGHILATKTTNPIVTDDDMAIPPPDTSDPHIGHKEEGRTICIHSLAVLPEYHRRGLATTLMQAYLQRIESHGVADRVALIAHEHLIGFYEKFGFVNKGRSEAQFGGGGWFDLVRELRPGHAVGGVNEIWAGRGEQ
ncbi:polyamine acetyltransferase [Teratosphaeria destructans]|uniref:Polyamine acetyltransferase n=1 Tax=Teratosphaeria destructans TaxID=418781 RepID=A0A9W7SUK1_9PEZI|nr:polyamine acetyltransferase [Teratosphaeria destructans]